jgi:DNA replication protein DnaC
MCKVARILELDKTEERLKLIREQLEGKEFIKRDNLPEPPSYETTDFVGEERKNLRARIEDRICIDRLMPIVGQGGFGKTALVVAACNNILYPHKKLITADTPPDEVHRLEKRAEQFDYVHFYSAKVSEFTYKTLTDVEREIELDRIKDVTEIFTGIAKDENALLNTQNTGDVSSVDTLLDYLNSNKVILVIDNAETIDDSVTTQFIERFVNESFGGSRLVITTRDHRIQGLAVTVPAMSENDSIELFKKILSVSEYSRIFNFKEDATDEIKGYCKDLENNPLYIKNFIEAVRLSRKEPTEIIDKIKERGADYCLSNVFEKQTQTGRNILYSLAEARERWTRTELKFINKDLSIENFDIELDRLHTNGWIERVIVDRTAYYWNSDNTKLFLEKLRNNNALPDNLNVFSEKVAEMERWKRNHELNVNTADLYSQRNIELTSKSGHLVSGNIKKALDLIFDKPQPDNYLEQATASLAEARELLSGQEEAEIYRVEAFIQSEQRRPQLPSYEKAIKIYKEANAGKPVRLAYRVWHIQSLLHEGNARQIGEAESEIAGVEQEDPKSLKIKELYINFLLKQGEYENAVAKTKELILLATNDPAHIESLKTEEREARKIHYLCVKVYSTLINRLKDDQKWGAVNKRFEELAENYEKFVDVFGLEYVDTSLETAYGKLDSAAHRAWNKNGTHGRTNLEQIIKRLPDSLQTNFQAKLKEA